MARGGGGIFCSNSGAKIMHNIIEDNHVTSSTLVTVGGGISGGPQNDNSWIVIEKNIIRNNSVTNAAVNSWAHGGGIELVQNARVINNVVEFNISQATLGSAWGGGIELGSGGQPRVRYCIGNKIWNNKALAPTGTYIDGGVGGGLSVAGAPRAEIRLNDIRYNEVEGNVSLNIDSWGAGVILQNQTSETIFAQNYVAFNKGINNSRCKGAGIVTWNTELSYTGGPQIINNIIKNNTGGTLGGGMFLGGLVSNSATLINNTINSNYATLGGAIYIGRDAAYPSHPIIINSIMWNNSSSIFVNTGSTVNVVYSDVEGGYTGVENINANPLFSDTLFNLSDSSPCIGAGIDSIEISGTWYYAPPTCYFGGPRPNPPGSMPDIGACESLLGSPVGVEDKNNLPTEFVLEQNYPNPFNPRTSIQYAVSSRQFVSLEVYDVLGNEIATLVNEEKPAGSYKVEFEAESFSSGIYFYKLSVSASQSQNGQAGKMVETKKMILLR
jgi:hypothetical protein